MKLDDIPASADTVMTAELKRLFKYARCDPTICHACLRPIKIGDTFKLVPHVKPDQLSTDEMCCAKHGEADLTRRDKREAKRRPVYPSVWRSASSAPSYSGGYSRPSKPAAAIGASQVAPGESNA